MPNQRRSEPRTRGKHPARAVLVSACLLGEAVRYDGSAAPLEAEAMDRWREKARLVPFCPEIAAGMLVPRNPAEIRGGDGHDVLDGRARVLECTLEDVTETFVRGAQAALETARACGMSMALLKEASPSCGSSVMYDGSFNSVVRPGTGVPAALLFRNGVRVFSEVTLAEAEEHLASVESDDRGPDPRRGRPARDPHGAGPAFSTFVHPPIINCAPGRACRPHAEGRSA